MLHQVFHHQGGLLRGNGEKLVEAQMRLLIGNIGDRANDNKRYAIVVADVRDGGGFHFYRDGLREVVADFGETNGTVDECVAADNESANRIKIQRADADLCGGNQLIIGFETGRAARQLAILIAKRGDVRVVIARFVGDDDIPLNC